MSEDAPDKNTPESLLIKTAMDRLRSAILPSPDLLGLNRQPVIPEIRMPVNPTHQTNELLADQRVILELQAELLEYQAQLLVAERASGNRMERLTWFIAVLTLANVAAVIYSIAK